MEGVPVVLRITTRLAYATIAAFGKSATTVNRERQGEGENREKSNGPTNSSSEGRDVMRFCGCRRWAG